MDDLILWAWMRIGWAAHALSACFAGAGGDG
jgi:hypothetical protein